MWCELSAEMLDDATPNVRKAPHSAKGDEVLIYALCKEFDDDVVGDQQKRES